MDADVNAVVEVLEEAFGIRFAPGELTDDSTLEELYAAVRCHMPDSASDRCLTSIVFLRLRRAYVSLFGTSKRLITPWSATDLLLPPRRSGLAWSALEETSGLKLPRLEYSCGMNHAMGWISVVPAMGLAIAGRGGLWIVGAVALWIVSLAVLHHMLRPYASSVPLQASNFGDLTKLTVALNYGRLSRELNSNRESEMLESVRYVIADAIGIEPTSWSAGTPGSLTW